MDAVVRLAAPTNARRWPHRIEDGSGFDDIAKLAGWDGIFSAVFYSSSEDAPLLGKSIAQEAVLEHKSPLDACCDLLIREHCQVTTSTSWPRRRHRRYPPQSPQLPDL